MTRLLLLVTVAATALGFAAAAQAHPLGNFTVNHFSRIEPAGDRLYVVYVLDMAEIPAFRERQAIADPVAWAARAAERTANQLQLRIDGEPVRLTPVRQVVAFPAGAAGLRTLRLEVVLQTPRLEQSQTPLELTYRDGTYPGRLGWKEIVVRASGDARLVSASAPADTVSGELTVYPHDLLQSPLDVTTATATFRPGAQRVAAPTLPAPTELEQRVAVRETSSTGFAKLVAERNLSLGFVLVSLLVALFWGAAHAFSPGHGKAIVAGYLVGTRGRPRDAAMLGLIVTVTHTAGVFALGGVTLLLSAFIVPEDLYPWLNLASALLVVGVGLTILRWRIRSWRRGEPLGGDHGHTHTHAHGHSHQHGHDYAHDGPDGHESSRTGLLGIGISAGIIPCPTALVVLLAAISLQRVAYGLVLIVAFSVGLAVAITSIGLVAITARRAFSRMSFEGRLIRALPAISAVTVLVLGAAMTARALNPLL
jgi:nickel/cobalt exporter